MPRYGRGELRDEDRVRGRRGGGGVGRHGQDAGGPGRADHVTPRGVLVLLAGVVLAAAAPSLRAQAPSPRVLVLPFDNVKRDPSSFWLGEGSAVLLTDDLNGIGAIAITREERHE